MLLPRLWVLYFPTSSAVRRLACLMIIIFLALSLPGSEARTQRSSLSSYQQVASKRISGIAPL